MAQAARQRITYNDFKKMFSEPKPIDPSSDNIGTLCVTVKEGEYVELVHMGVSVEIEAMKHKNTVRIRFRAPKDTVKINRRQRS